MSDLAKRSGDLVSLLEKMKPAIAQALPKHISAERIARIALTAVRSNPALAKCSPQSFLGSLLQASQLGLEVNTPLGHAYLIPYGEVATLVIGYQGMLDLSRRSGMVKAIYAHPVFEGDTFEYELGLEPKLVHKPGAKRGQLTHVYAVARLTDGEPIFTVLDRADVERYRARSRASKSGPWVTDFDAMAMKTAVRRLFRWLPKSAEQASAAALDEASEHDQSQAEYYTPEVVGILETIPDEPAPMPIPAGTPEGRRIKLGGKQKSNGAGDSRASNGAASPATEQAAGAPHPPPQPAVPAPTDAAPAGLPSVEETHRALGQVDADWSGEEYADVISGWSSEQLLAAHTWARAVLDDGPMPIQARRPHHTIMVTRQPGED